MIAVPKPIALPLLLGLTLSGAVAAQTSRPTEASLGAVKADAESRQMLQKWRKLEYHLGRAGVTRISYRVDASCKLGPAPLKQTTATYRWTNKAGKGRLAWKDEALGQLLAELGWGKDQLDLSQVPDVLPRWLEGCELTAADTPHGYKLVKVSGSPAGLRELHFDNDGVLIGMRQDAALPRGGRVQMAFHLSYHKDGDKYHVDGWTYKVTLPGGDEQISVAKLSYKKMSGFHVIDRAEETTTLGGKTVSYVQLKFSKHRFNKAVAGKEGTEEGKRK